MYIVRICGRRSSTLLTGHFIKVLLKEPVYVCQMWCSEIFVQKSNFLFVFFEIKAWICCVFLVQIWVQSLYSNDPFLVCNIAVQCTYIKIYSGWLASMKNRQKIAFSDSRLPRKKKNGVNTSQVFRRAILLLARSKLEPDTSIKRTSLFIKSIARLYQNPPEFAISEPASMAARPMISTSTFIRGRVHTCLCVFERRK